MNVREAGSKVGQFLPEHVKDHVRPVWLDVISHAPGEFINHPRTRIMISPSGVCNLGCTFCAYRHKERPKVIMPNERFFALVDQATQLGYTQIGLTPMTGDVYTDPEFTSKLSYLEEHPGVEEHYFFTNLTLPTREELAETLTDCAKLTAGDKSMYVSVYGHDRESFTEITGGEDRHYDRLVDNLAFLTEFVDDPAKIDVGFRTYASVDPIDVMANEPLAENELLANVRALRDAVGVHVESYTGVYNNWGGTVTDEDVAGVDMEIAPAETEKRGACQLIFNKNIVLPDGTVNACACRDVEATLQLGDALEEPLAKILSPSENDTYARLIERHVSGDYPEICESCDLYRSIEVPEPGPTIDLETFREHFDPMKESYEPGRSTHTPGY